MNSQFSRKHLTERQVVIGEVITFVSEVMFWTAAFAVIVIIPFVILF